MIRIFDIAQKDLLQLLRDRQTFLFLLFMPIIFTLLFGFAFGGFNSSASDARLPVGWLDQDGGRVSKKLYDLFSESEVIRLENNSNRSVADLEQLVAEKKLAGAIIVPPGYTRAMLDAKSIHLKLIGDTSDTTGMTIQSEIIATVSKLDSAVRTATLMEEMMPQRAPFEYAFKQSLAKWKEPPITVSEIKSAATSNQPQGNAITSLAHTSPGMMLQFAIAGLLTAAQVIVGERKSRALQRLLTTATRRIDILLGHYLAIFVLILSELAVMILFGSFILRINYLREPAAIFVVACACALCIGAMGLLIGVFARSEEQAVIFSLVPMFLMAGLGGAWVPLEVTGEMFQLIGHLSPIAWGMDGFKNITIRGLGFESVLPPAFALVCYAALFFTIATWRFRMMEER